MRKRVEVRTKENKLYKVFDSANECADYFSEDLHRLYRWLGKPERFFIANGEEYNFRYEITKEIEDKIKEKVGGRISYSDISEIELRKNETEDQTRRRLGLNPYGEWRNDEWLFAMFDRVNKRLYPDGYDEHAAWLAMKGKDRMEKGKTRVSQETLEESYKDIDEEFLDYLK